MIRLLVHKKYLNIFTQILLLKYFTTLTIRINLTFLPVFVMESGKFYEIDIKYTYNKKLNLISSGWIRRKPRKLFFNCSYITYISILGKLIQLSIFYN